MTPAEYIQLRTTRRGLEALSIVWLAQNYKPRVFYVTDDAFRSLLAEFPIDGPVMPGFPAQEIGLRGVIRVRPLSYPNFFM